MVKRKLRLRLKKERFEAARSKTKDMCFVKQLEKNREIIAKDNIKVEIKLKRSLIGKLPNKVKTIKALGLKRIGDKKIHTLNNSIKGMLNETINMILVNEVE